MGEAKIRRDAMARGEPDPMPGNAGLRTVSNYGKTRVAARMVDRDGNVVASAAQLEVTSRAARADQRALQRATVQAYARRYKR